MTSTLATTANHQDNPRVSHPSWCQRDLCCAAVEPDRLSHRAILRFPEDDSLSVEILGGDVFDEAGGVHRRRLGRRRARQAKADASSALLPAPHPPDPDGGTVKDRG